MVTTVFFWEPLRLCVSPREKATGIQLKIFALLAARLHSVARAVHGAGFWRCWCSCAPGIELGIKDTARAEGDWDSVHVLLRTDGSQPPLPSSLLLSLYSDK